jgi:hypothetical protein
MPKTKPAAEKKTDFDTVRKVGLALPGAEEGTTYGTPALKVGGRMFCCLAAHRSAEPGSLVVLIDFDERDELIAADPDTYYLTDHYVNYPSVLVRLRRVHPDALRDLLHGAWRMAVERRATRRGRARAGAGRRSLRRPR